VPCATPALQRERRAGVNGLRFAAAGCFTVMLTMTLTLNMPINLAIFRWDEEHGDPARGGSYAGAGT